MHQDGGGHLQRGGRAACYSGGVLVKHLIVRALLLLVLLFAAQVKAAVFAATVTAPVTAASDVAKGCAAVAQPDAHHTCETPLSDLDGDTAAGDGTETEEYALTRLHARLHLARAAGLPAAASPAAPCPALPALERPPRSR